MIKVNLENIPTEHKDKSPDGKSAATARALSTLPGTGWLDLPHSYNQALSGKIKAAAKRIQEQSDVLVVIGIGGSYLGARAITDALGCGVTQVIYAGNGLSGRETERATALIGERDFSVSVVSKSGATVETAAAFRFFSELLIRRYGDSAYERVYVTAGTGESPLRRFALTRGCELFDIPDGVGGRYSALTPVGLLPAAVCGADIDAIMRGALGEFETGADSAYAYAAARQSLYGAGWRTEALAFFEPSLRYFGEWWRQLYGESEGKNKKGVFPSTLLYSTDLHSMGQFMQDGARDVFETVLWVDKPLSDLAVPRGAMYDDGLADITGLALHELCGMVKSSVVAAHADGGVPVIELTLPELTCEALGALIYFFETSCAYSALLSGVNPFDQPGVEEYKSRLRKMLSGEK
jgi:glucose-6-phosphate isomerase